MVVVSSRKFPRFTIDNCEDFFCLYSPEIGQVIEINRSPYTLYEIAIRKAWDHGFIVKGDDSLTWRSISIVGKI